MNSKPHGDGGKTHARRNEDTPRVERNWSGIDWNAREREALGRVAEQAQAKLQEEAGKPYVPIWDAAKLREEGKPFTAHAVEAGFLPIDGDVDEFGDRLIGAGVEPLEDA